MDFYILNENDEPVIEKEIFTWSRWMGNSNRKIVAKETYKNLTISTVFLGMDHSWGRGQTPLLWETMVFGKDDSEEITERCSGTRKDALKMHNEVVERLKMNKRRYLWNRI